MGRFLQAFSTLILLMASEAHSTEPKELATLVQQLAHQYRDCEVNIRYLGDLPEESPAKVDTEVALFAAYEVVGCHGGNNWTSFVALYRSDEGKLTPLNGSPLEFAQILTPAFQGAKVVIEVVEYDKGDSHCCPTLSRTLKI